ncbi:GAF domain-containing protein [Salarchaeum sp. III]|uniref:GAF domain-containing protein n=1 Tax=Salarchaeum sp. III TaxID=3107927 RepID=UPI002ED9C20D
MSPEPSVRSRVLWVTSDAGPDGGRVADRTDRFAVNQGTPTEAMDRLAAGTYSAVVTDTDLDGDGLAFLRRVRDRYDALPLVLLTTEDPDSTSARAAADARVTACHPVDADATVLARRLEPLLNTYEGGTAEPRENAGSVLADLNDVVYRVVDAAFRQNTRRDITELVCRELADTDSYRFAWVAERDEDGATRVAAEAKTDGYMDDIDLRLDAPPAERGPSASAAHTGDVHTVDDTLTDDAFAGWRERAHEHGVRSSAAVPLHTDDDTYGVLNIYSQRPHAFADREREALSRLGQLVANAIATVERRHRYETLVRNLPNGAIALFDADKRCLTVGGEAFADEDEVDTSALEGARVEDLDILPERFREWWSDAIDDALGGDRVSAELETDNGVSRIQVLPVHAGESVESVLALTQDITERKTRQRQVEAERERLEFLNRLIRHNLLNGLNVINARCQLVASAVDDPDASEHVEHIRNRGADLADLVEKMRTLMDAIVGDADHSLRRMALADTLEAKLSLAAEMHPDARFTADLPEDVSVLGDELLGEVFENVLDNAVTHNDADTPIVDVTVTETTTTAYVDGDGTHVPDPDRLDAVEAVECPAVTVEIADNGPGIPEDEREGVLETGVSQLSEPGSGFGLYLVKQMLQSYGGSIEIRENEPRGTVFELTFLTEHPNR